MDPPIEPGAAEPPERNAAMHHVHSENGRDMGLPIATKRPRPRRAIRSVDVDDPAEVFRLWQYEVWKFLRRLGVPRHRLEDATQDVFVIAYKNWSRFEGRSSRKVWVYGIAVRVARQHIRHRSNKEGMGDFSTVEETTTRGQWGAPPLSPFDSTARGEARRLLQKLLGRLRTSHRELLVLVELEHQTIEEAAFVLGLTVKAADSRLQRARAKFNKAIARYRAEDERRLR